MPELPEVETVVRAIRPSLVHQTITHFETDWPNQIKSPKDSVQFTDRLIGQKIVDVHRRAKYIVIELENEYLIIHLRMSGHLSVADADSPYDKYVHGRFTLSNGQELRFRDVRKFGTFDLVVDKEIVLGKLGPEPLEDSFTADVLRERLHNRKSKMKPLLLNQTFVAGVGNIYADEALFRAKIHPERTADTLTQSDIVALHEAIRHVLSLGIAREGASIDTYVQPDGRKGDMQNAVEVFRRTGMPCYICGTEIVRIKLAQRSTHFCPNCQR